MCLCLTARCRSLHRHPYPAASCPPSVLGPSLAAHCPPASQGRPPAAQYIYPRSCRCRPDRYCLLAGSRCPVACCRLALRPSLAACPEPLSRTRGRRSAAAEPVAGGGCVPHSGCLHRRMPRQPHPAKAQGQPHELGGFSAWSHLPRWTAQLGDVGADNAVAAEADQAGSFRSQLLLGVHSLRVKHAAMVGLLLPRSAVPSERLRPPARRPGLVWSRAAKERVVDVRCDGLLQLLHCLVRCLNSPPCRINTWVCLEASFHTKHHPHRPGLGDSARNKAQ